MENCTLRMFLRSSFLTLFPKLILLLFVSQGWWDGLEKKDEWKRKLCLQCSWTLAASSLSLVQGLRSLCDLLECPPFSCLGVSERILHPHSPRGRHSFRLSSFKMTIVCRVHLAQKTYCAFLPVLSHLTLSHWKAPALFRIISKESLHYLQASLL